MRRSDSIQNNRRVGPRSQLLRPKSRNCGAVRHNFALKARLPGTEFWDAETGRQKSSRKSVNPCRDQSPRSKRPEIPAETPYLASCRKRAVCGDWMVDCAVTREPVSASHPPVIPCYLHFFREGIPACCCSVAARSMFLRVNALCFSRVNYDDFWH